MSEHTIVLIWFLDKRENIDSEEDNFVTILMNLFNAIYAFTALQMEIILMMRAYDNNSKNTER